MDLPLLGGVILCPVCHEPLAVTLGFVEHLRQLVCINVRCRNYRRLQENSLYTQVPGQPTSVT